MWYAEGVPNPVDFLQDDDGDLALPLTVVSDLPTYTEQTLRVNLSSFLGEWFLNTLIGLPLFRDVIGQQYDQALVQAMYRRAAERTRGVGSVDRVTVEYDYPTRVLSIPELSYFTVEGEAVDPGPFIVDLG